MTNMFVAKRQRRSGRINIEFRHLMTAAYPVGWQAQSKPKSLIVYSLREYLVRSRNVEFCVVTDDELDDPMMVDGR